MGVKQSKGITKSWRKERRKLIITFILVSIAVVCCTVLIIITTMVDVSPVRVIWLKDAQNIRLLSVQEGDSVEISLTESDQKAIQAAFSNQNLEKMNILKAFFNRQYDCIIQYEDTQTLISIKRKKGYCSSSDGKKLYFELTEEQQRVIAELLD